MTPMNLIDRRYGYAELSGMVPAEHGGVQSNSTTKWAELWATIQESAYELGIAIHGATIGQLDAEALFYLRSRGLNLEQSRDVLIHAFASDLLGRIAIEPIRRQLDAVLLQELPGSGHMPFAVA